MTDFDDFEEDFDQEEFKRVSQLRQKETLKTIEAHIAANKDDRMKTVGDQILLWDSSRLTNVETSEIEYDTKIHAILNTYPSIVIADQVKYKADLQTLAGDFSKNLDLVIWNKTLNKKFRTSSEFVKLYNVR